MSLTAMLRALGYRLGPTQEIVIVGNASDAQPLIEETRRYFLPNATLLFHDLGAEAESLTEIVPFVANLKPIDGRPAAYVCENYACRRPVTTREDLRHILSGIARRS